MLMFQLETNKIVRFKETLCESVFVLLFYQKHVDCFFHKSRKEWQLKREERYDFIGEDQCFLKKNVELLKTPLVYHALRSTCCHSLQANTSISFHCLQDLFLSLSVQIA